MRQDLLPGTLDMLVLKALSLAPMHGYAIAQYLRQVSRDVVTVEEGSLYPALQRLLARGWVTVNWRETPTKRQARYYTLTAAGRKRLGQEVSEFTTMMDAIQRILAEGRP
jgi:PadR family transcriptional regulator, regulatory protein PadR